MMTRLILDSSLTMCKGLIINEKESLELNKKDEVCNIHKKTNKKQIMKSNGKIKAFT